MCMLPFSLCSVPTMFNAIAEAMEWILLLKGVCYLQHHLDDFNVGQTLVVGCQFHCQLIQDVCSHLGIILAAMHQGSRVVVCIVLLAFEWEDSSEMEKTAVKELVSIVVVAAIWGLQLEQVISNASLTTRELLWCYSIKQGGSDYASASASFFFSLICVLCQGFTSQGGTISWR